MVGRSVTFNSRRVQIMCLACIIASSSVAATAMGVGARPTNDKPTTEDTEDRRKNPGSSPARGSFVTTAQPVSATAESAEAYLQTGWDRLHGGDFEAAAA